MIVLDTHALLWWVTKDRRMSAGAKRAIVRTPDIGVATVSAWELATLVRLGRINLRPDVRTWVQRALALDGVRSIPLTPEIAIAAGSLGSTFAGDPADRIIYATAQAEGAQLVTKDRRLRDADPARVVW